MNKIDVNNAECSICSKEAHGREEVEEKFGYRLVLNIPIQRCKECIRLGSVCGNHECFKHNFEHYPKCYYSNNCTLNKNN